MLKDSSIALESDEQVSILLSPTSISQSYVFRIFEETKRKKRLNTQAKT
jgi:hypothetical protein